MNWVFHKDKLINSLSRIEGILQETEEQYRKDSAKFIHMMGCQLKLHYKTIATATVFFHRFFIFHSFNTFNRWVICVSCLFLAGKVEETPKKCKDLSKVAYDCLLELNKINGHPVPEQITKDIILLHEKILLQTIYFDLNVEHPYSFLLSYAKKMNGSKEQINEIVQISWSFINDSYSTHACLLYKPEIIALTTLKLSFDVAKKKIHDYFSDKSMLLIKLMDNRREIEEIHKLITNLYGGKIERIKN